MSFQDSHFEKTLYYSVVVENGAAAAADAAPLGMNSGSATDSSFNIVLLLLYSKIGIIRIMDIIELLII